MQRYELMHMCTHNRSVYEQQEGNSEREHARRIYEFTELQRAMQN